MIENKARNRLVSVENELNKTKPHIDHLFWARTQ